jgi:hypothetical protein
MAYGRSSPRRGVALTGGTLVGLAGCGPLVPYDTDDAGDDGTSGTSAGSVSADTTATTTVAVTTSQPPPPGTTTTTGPPPLEGPPQLIDAYFLTEDTLQLVFSEPIAPTDGVDPTKFRLSLAHTSSGYYGESYTTHYNDVGNWNGEEYCYEYCGCNFICDTEGECYEWCYTMQGPILHVSGMENGPASHQVVLTLDHPIKPSVCGVLKDIQEYGYDGGLFVHYSNNGFPGIVDTQSEPLDAIAEHWVLRPHDRWANQQGDFPFMDPYIPIPCPF